MAKLIEFGHTMCAGCGLGIFFNIISKVCPKDVITCMATSCLEITTSGYPTTSWLVPNIHVAFENVSAVATGISEAVKRLGKNWKVLAFAGDGGTYDIGLQALSGMLERRNKVTQICLMNGAYMNTGIQRSSGTPYGAWTTTSPPGKKSIGKTEWKKPFPFIAAAHRIPYVATASVAEPVDLMNKFKKALEKQPSFLDVDIPCPTGWKFDSGNSIQVSKLGVETGFLPLYEIEDGVLKITKRPEKRKPVVEYLKTQGRFKHLQEKEIKEIQEHVDKEWERLEKIEVWD